MILRSLTLSGFRSFGPTPTRIDFDERVTALLGANGTGKTAILAALARMFGVNGRGRGLTSSDFHLPLGQAPNTTRKLFMEALFELTELLEDEADHSAVPVTLVNLTCCENGKFWLRMRLEGELSFADSLDGDIDEELFSITSLEEDFKEKEKTRIRASTRNRIHVHYVPASRDPVGELRYSASSILGRLLRSGRWSDEHRADVQNSAIDASSKMDAHPVVQKISEEIARSWNTLYRGKFFSKASLCFIPSELEDLLRATSLIFSYGPDRAVSEVSRLSDGQRSLLYISLIIAAHAIEQYVNDADPSEDNAFDVDRLRPPVFVLLALEEPENHLAPHYLGRVMMELQRFSAKPNAQTIVSTHSAGMVKRIHPNSIRHLRLTSARETSIQCVLLPKESSDAYQFVTETLRSYPEIFFSKVVVLCEGESERIILPRMLNVLMAQCEGEEVRGGKSKKAADPLGLDVRETLTVDDSFLSIVPIGGRHVNHFWRLLFSIKIPFVTLLDMDLGRYHGGWGRIKYVANQIIRWSNDESRVRDVKKTRRGIPVWDKSSPLSEEIEEDEITWIDWLEQMDAVFFSSPLDLDFMMLESYGGFYKHLSGGEVGPLDFPSDPDEQEGYEERLLAAVLKGRRADADFYEDEQLELFRWYRYRFLSNGKPSSHLSAFSRMTDEDIVDNAPDVLVRMACCVKKLVLEEDE